MAAAIFWMSARLALRHGMPSVVQLPKKISAIALGDNRAEAVFLERLRRVLARAAAAEIGAGQQDRGALEPRIVERMRLVRAVGVLADVVKEVLAEAVERDAFHEPRRDDPVGVDVIARHVNSAAGD